MLPEQRKIGEVMIEPDRAGPIRGIMAITAARTELAFVRIVARMAINTSDVRERHVNRRDVARGAFGRFVFALEREGGVNVVIKPHLGPCCRDMARLTVSAENAFVNIIIDMTGDAFG